jgi:hypothetical protein
MAKWIYGSDVLFICGRNCDDDEEKKPLVS